MSYARFLQNSIFEPLKMFSTGYDDNVAVLKNRAVGYASPNLKASYIDMSVIYATGGLYSTVEDLYQWDQALFTDKLVPKHLRDEMFKPQVKAYWGADVHYGYGWAIDWELDRRVIEHGGNIEGFSTENMLFPDDRVIVIMLSNCEHRDMHEIAKVAAQMVLR